MNTEASASEGSAEVEVAAGGSSPAKGITATLNTGSSHGRKKSSRSVSSSNNSKQQSNADTSSREIASSTTPMVNNSQEGSGDNPSPIGPPNHSSFCKLLPFSQMTVTVYIPTVCVGAVIGRRGTTIAQIQKQAQQLTQGSGGGSPAHASANQVRVSIVGHNATAKVQGGINSSSGHDLTFNSNSNTFMTDYPSPILSSSPQNTNTASQSLFGHSTTTVVPYTYTELDFTNPQWTPVVIRADPNASLFVAQSILDLCLEYVLDRKQLVYIFDLPIPSTSNPSTSGGGTSKSPSPPASTSQKSNKLGGGVTSTNIGAGPNNGSGSGKENNNNNNHATIVGKRGQTLMQLSADHKCRIMVPPKQLQHDIIQLEGPLQECISCLQAIAALLHKVSETTSAAIPVTAATTSSTATPTTSSSGNGTKKDKAGTSISSSSNTNSNNSKPFEITLIVQPLPSQQRLRNIARKTDTVIKKKRTTAEPEGTTEVVHEDGTTVPSMVPWQLTILAPTEGQALAAQTQLQKSPGIDMTTLVSTNVPGAVEIASDGPNAKDYATAGEGDIVGDMTDDMDNVVMNTSSAAVPQQPNPTSRGGGRGGGRGGNPGRSGGNNRRNKGRKGGGERGITNKQSTSDGAPSSE